MNVRGYRDPLTLAIDIAQERNKALVLWEMEKKKKQLPQLCLALPGMSKEEVCAQLDELIELQLVSRVVKVKRKPTLIEYALTNRGAMLLKCLRKMMDVGINIMLDYHMADVLMEEGYIELIPQEEESRAEEGEDSEEESAVEA